MATDVAIREIFFTDLAEKVCAHPSDMVGSDLFRCWCHNNNSCTPDKDPGVENLILPMLSYPGRLETSSCEIRS